jgi:hypothetical protein
MRMALKPLKATDRRRRALSSAPVKNRVKQPKMKFSGKYSFTRKG